MKYFSLIILFLFIIMGIWSVFVEPNILVVKKIVLKDSNLADLKIVFASDFHIKPYEKYRLTKIVKKINRQNPDIVLLGGDYVSGHDASFTMSPEKIASELRKINSKYGTVAVMGNHDGWQGKYGIIKALENAGITVLENSNKNFDRFTIVGIEDLQTGNPNIEKALKNADKNIILLTHNPDMFPLVPNNVRLVLAGHLHGGQIMISGITPAYIPSQYGMKYRYGLIEENGKTLYTSNGLGTSILPVRFNSVPEIVVIEFSK
jgi:predicted MPP superfamily phosphohydrolase